MSMPVVLLWTAFLSFLPISELRGAIPFSIAHGLPWYFAYPFAVVLNALVAPACWIFLSTLHKLFLKMNWYSNFFERFVARARNKLRGNVEKWGWLGIAAFVAIPLPITGAWTGTLGAWMLGLSRKRTCAAVTLGVIAAGAIVTLITVAGIKALDIFTKRMEL
ncbi:MAG: small multi-drug export protein [Treponema sp.]|jgi:uncharacterized membrane protein|nr:small multi-drug export protein [Treponema sp.]